MIRRTVILIFCLMIGFPVYAGDRHHPAPVQQDVQNSDNGSNFWSNVGEAAIWGGVICGGCIIAEGCRIPFTKIRFCYIYKKPVEVSNTMTPEIPENEYLIIRQKR